MTYKDFPEYKYWVKGVDQHGEEISFEENTIERAEWHASRYSRLGGNVRIIEARFNAPYAGWLPTDPEERRKLYEK